MSELLLKKVTVLREEAKWALAGSEEQKWSIKQ